MIFCSVNNDSRSLVQDLDEHKLITIPIPLDLKKATLFKESGNVHRLNESSMKQKLEGGTTTKLFLLPAVAREVIIIKLVNKYEQKTAKL